jgi:hypothetical protein
MTNERNAYYREINAALGEMKWLFDDQPKAAGYRDYFEETLDANELEIALHALCNFLLETTTRPVPESVIAQIQAVHAAMGLQDQCVSKLREKRSFQPAS